MSFCVYELELEQNKKYFGTTPTWRKAIRMDEHSRGVASKWTRRFPPTSKDPANLWFFETRKVAYKFEDDRCCEHLQKHGIDSCRGGLQNADLGVPYHFWVRPHLRNLIS